MGESLTERRRVNEEGLTVVKFFSWGRIKIGVECRSDDIIQGISPGQLRASSRGIRKGQALFGIIGRKGRVGGFVSQM